MDETALQYNMPSNKTVNKVGAKTITIRTQRQEKCRISVILSICANRNKLNPLIIFKGAKNGKIYKSLLNHEYVKQKKCVIACNKNAWANKEIIRLWIDKIYIPYFEGKNLSKTLLVFDRASMHDSLEIIKYLISKNINFVFIPKGLTSILQPLDVSINHPFKIGIKHAYEYAITCFKTEKVPKVKKEINF